MRIYKNSFNKLKKLMVLLIAVFITIGFAAVERDGEGGNRLTKTTNKAGDAYRMFINNLDLPINRAGVIADVLIGGRSGGEINGLGFLFSSGFFMSGVTNGSMWSNAVASASRIQDYEPGTVADGRNDSRAQLYVVRVQDGDFSQSWEDWRDAVALGANFYDGDGDGVYNPVDLNNNGKWDPEEDRPDLIGDEVVWCVYSDGVDPALRRFNDVEPQGIEIRQSVFAFASKGVTGNMVFVRYEILNTGTVADVIEDVYFGVWADPDLGDFEDDLVGSDISLDAGFVYNDGADGVFGNNPPCFLIDFFQGPVSYIPGETFVDNDGNGVYDEGIDTPLDTAYDVRGQVRGIAVFPGAKNLGMSSFVHYMQSHPLLGDPDTRSQARNYLLGTDKNGTPLDPCTWTFGSVLGGVNCAEVDNRFFYNGDPVTQTGWINNFPVDQRQMSNTGPFKLQAGVPVTITAAYVVGRGTSALNSVQVAKEYDIVAQALFDANFPSPPPPPPVDAQVRTGDDFIEFTFPTAPHLNYRAVDTVLDIDRRVQGFYVTAYRTNSKAGTIEGLSNSEVLLRYDLADSINSIYVIAPNGGVDLRMPQAPAEQKLDSLVYGNPETGRIRFRVTQDAFTGNPLIKGQEYYYTITQYTLNHNVIVNRATGTYGPGGDYYDPLGVAVEEYETPIIPVTFGKDLYDPSISGSTAQRTEGASSGEVKYIVVNKEALTGDEYTIEFFQDNAPQGNNPYTPYWRLINNNSGAVLIDSSKVYNFDTTSYAGRVVEGFIPKIRNVVPQIATDSLTYSGTKWYKNFSVLDGSGVYYVGRDIPQATDHPLRAGRSNVIQANDLRRVEIRFGQTSKAYRFLNGYIGTPVTRRGTFVYSRGITGADTTGNKGAVGQWDAANDHAMGFIDVPYSVWVVDPRYGEERQLTTAFIEASPLLFGNPDGNWNPGDSLLLSKELIIILNEDYDPNGNQMHYTGGDFNGDVVWGDIARGFTIPAGASVTDQQRLKAASPWYDAMYIVGFQRSQGAFYQAGEVFTIPIAAYPYTSRDKFVFRTTPGGAMSEDERKDIFNNVNVFPNPLFGYNPATSYTNSNPDEPFVTFSNLPEEITVKIFSLSGTLVRTLNTSDKSNTSSPFLRWNLENENGLRVASGMYLAIVSSPIYGEKILKFAIIMPQKQIQRF
jgi:hypothetical protein